MVSTAVAESRAVGSGPAKRGRSRAGTPRSRHASPSSAGGALSASRPTGARRHFRDRALSVLEGRAREVASGIYRRATAEGLATSKRKKADGAARYLKNKAPYLDYPTALAAGWPIATGIIEGAVALCRPGPDVRHWHTLVGRRSRSRPQATSNPCERQLRRLLALPPGLRTTVRPRVALSRGIIPLAA